MSQSIENWAQRVCAGEVRALSRAITAIENHEPEAEELLRLLFPRTGKAYLTGVTGAPGTGKSTLVDRLAAHYRAKQEQVGVIAVDPTSPYSGGAILGDRIRMQGHAGDSRRVGAGDRRSGAAAGCRGEATSADRDGGRRPG